LWDTEIPAHWKTAGFVQEITAAAAGIDESNPNKSLALVQFALAVAHSIKPDAYPPPVQMYVEGHAWKQIGYAQRYLTANDAALRAFDAAQRCFGRESALIHDQATAQLAQAAIYMFHRPLNDEALPLIEQSTATLEDYNDKRRLVMAEVMRATIHQTRGELKIARAQYENLLERMKGTDDLYTLACLYHNLGVLVTELGEVNNAIPLLRRAKEIYAHIGVPIEKTDWALTRVLLSTGEFSSALPLLRHLRTVLLERGTLEEAGLIGLDIVEALIATGETEEARTLTEQVLAEFRNANLNRRAGIALAYLRDLLPTSQKPQRAIRHVRTYVEELRTEPELLFVPFDED
jgi:tetratricopeptide (TPR) repeat protein